jgi:hypothetical protein
MKAAQYAERSKIAIVVWQRSQSLNEHMPDIMLVKADQLIMF